jgi:thymidine kinase
MKLSERPGKIDVICGPMSSGKSEELIRRIKRHQIAGRKVEIFKSELDDRDYSKIVSRNGQIVDKWIKVVKHSNVINDQISWWEGQNELPNVIAIDEAQFLDVGVVDVVNRIVDLGIDVLVAGLEKDRDGAPFGPMPLLLAISDNVEKLHAVCMKCKRDEATFSYLFGKAEGAGQVVVGGDDKYEARCRKCWYDGRPEYDAPNYVSSASSR